MCTKGPLNTRFCNRCRVHEEEKSSLVMYTGNKRNRDRLLWLSLQKKLLRLTLILLLPLDLYSMTPLKYKLLFLYFLPNFHLAFKWPNHILICFLCSCYVSFVYITWKRSMFKSHYNVLNHGQAMHLLGSVFDVK